MFVLTLLVFVASLAIVGVAATRGLLHVDDILEIRDERDSDTPPSAVRENA